jgi:RNA polymerase-binding transcription factor DksA
MGRSRRKGAGIDTADSERRALELRELREEFVEESVRIIGEQRWAGREGFSQALPADGTERNRFESHASSPAARGRSKQASRLQAIERALELLARGEYGTCVCCGQPISTARLRAAPDAKLCCACLQAEPRP